MEPEILLLFIFSLACVKGQSLQKVSQWPSQSVVTLGSTVELQCSQSSSDSYMYWYRQQRSTGLQLIMLSVYMSEPERGEKISDRFSSTRPKMEIISLTISQAEESDTGVYFCAASRTASYEAYFGGGTKLTVIGKDDKILEPKVQILKPSRQEIRSKKHVTLVCVATDFYPDHVSITWSMNSIDETPRSKMDESAVLSKESKTYSITSRLRVTEKEWHNSRNTFQCSVSFFNGTNTTDFPATIRGIQYCGTTAEENKWRGNAAEVSYILILVKSSLFAAFLTAFVWRLKGLPASKFVD